MFNQFRNQRFNASFQEALTVDALRDIVPSAFAVAKHESRSNRYTYIPTSEVITGLMLQGFRPFKAMQSRSRIEGKTEYTKHMIRFRHASEVVKGDSAPEVILVNSHDGTSAYKLYAGLLRFICSNGMITFDELHGHLAVPHKGNIVERVIEGSFEIIGQSNRALEVSEDWQRLALTNGEQRAFAEAAHILRFDERENENENIVINTPITPAQLLTVRRPEDNGGNLWHTLNRVQENVIAGGLRGTSEKRDAVTGRLVARPRRVTTRPVNGIDQDIKLNRALWKLADEMAKLKGADTLAA